MTLTVEDLHARAVQRIDILRDLAHERLVAATKLAEAKKRQKQLRNALIAGGIAGKNEAERNAHLDVTLSRDDQNRTAERIVEEQTEALEHNQIEHDFHSRMFSLELATIRALGNGS